MKKLFVPFLLLFLAAPSFAQDYTQLDSIIRSLPNKEYATLKQLTNDIILPSYSEDEKVRAFAIWMTENIEYDITYKNSWSAIETLKRRKGVCNDYSVLFKALCDSSSIECHLITGKARIYGSQIGLDIRSNHAWNIVKVNHEYQIFDITWASGHIYNNKFKKKFKEHYLNANPKQFIVDHFPDESKWQLLDTLISNETFINQPCLNSDFFDLNIQNLTPSTGVVRSDTFCMKFSSDQEITKCVLFKRKINDYGTMVGINLPIKRTGNEYSITYINKGSGGYRGATGQPNVLNFYLNDNAQITYKIASPRYIVSRPTDWDLKDPYKLIYAYHYIFQRMDIQLFKKLNPNSEIQDLKKIEHAEELNQRLSDWFGDYLKSYGNGMDGEVHIPIRDFKVVLQKVDSEYRFDRIIK